MADRPTTNLIEGIQNTDPRLYQFLHQLNDALLQVQNDLYPIQRALSEVISTAAPADVVNFTYTLQSNGVRFDWNSSTGASQYEIRKGVSFELGEQVLVTS